MRLFLALREHYLEVIRGRVVTIYCENCGKHVMVSKTFPDVCTGCGQLHLKSEPRKDYALTQQDKEFLRVQKIAVTD